MTETIVAPATPQGSSALAVLRLSGPRAFEFASRLTGLAPAPGRHTVGRILDEGRVLDQAVLAWFAGPRTYTGEDLVEISTHGAPYVRARLIELCLEAGARAAAPGEFTLRAFLNGRMDLSQAEAVADLIRARSARAHRAAVAALEGGVSSRVAGLRDRLLALAARAEVAIDHPDEDVPLLDPREAAQTAGALRAELQAWLGRAPAERLVRDGLRVAIVGPANAGKSSLLNALLGRDRAIVLDEPGTTRDVLEERAELDGSPVVLVDTAGLREGRLDAAESLGIERTRRAIDAADLCLVVLDGARPLADADRGVLTELERPGRRALRVLNKADLPRRCELDGLPVSATRGDGMNALVSEIRAACAESAPDDEAIASNARQREALSDAARALGEAEAAWQGGASGEFPAVHLREALDALGRVVGGAAGPDLLSAIFSRFCIGK